jgi:hypothetical protein
LQLQTQLVATEMTLFEVYSFSILEHLQQFFNHVIQGFQKIAKSDQTLFADIYKYSLLKASITLAQIFLKFLTVPQVEQLIVCVIQSADLQGDRETDLVSIVLDSISKESKHHPKLMLQAAFNSYFIVIANNARLNFNAWRFFGQLLKPLLTNLPKEFI